MRVVLALPSETRTRELVLDVPRGVTLAPDVVVGSGAVGGVRGVLRSRAGLADIDATLRLQALDGSGYEFEERVWSRGGRRPFTFRGSGADGGYVDDAEPGAPLAFDLGEVPEGSYELTVADGAGFRWTPPSVELVVPAQGLEFVREDASGVESCAFEIVDADSEDPLSAYAILVEVDGCSRYARFLDPGEELELARDAGFRFEVTAPGHRPARGDAHAIAAHDGRRTARVALARGFGATVHVRAWSGASDGDVRLARTRSLAESGLGGAEILCGGARLAVTGADGTAEVELADAPPGLDVHLRGWRVLDARGLERPSWSAGTIDVWMVRE